MAPGTAYRPTFKLSTDPAFVEKLTDVVGLYLNPPEKAVVLCVDEKSVQALDRTSRVDEAGPAVRAKRHERPCSPRSRHRGRLDRAFPPDLTLHIILDNYEHEEHPRQAA